jgi:hypothetical protein
MRKMRVVLLTVLAAMNATQDASARRLASGAAAALAAVKSQMPDPASASFERVRGFRDAICGTVEGKSNAGAFTGRMLFVFVRPEGKAYILDLPSERGQDAANAAVEAYEKYCQR